MQTKNNCLYMKKVFILYGKCKLKPHGDSIPFRSSQNDYPQENKNRLLGILWGKRKSTRGWWEGKLVEPAWKSV